MASTNKVLAKMFNVCRSWCWKIHIEAMPNTVVIVSMWKCFLLERVGWLGQLRGRRTDERSNTGPLLYVFCYGCSQCNYMNIYVTCTLHNVISYNWIVSTTFLCALNNKCMTVCALLVFRVPVSSWRMDSQLCQSTRLSCGRKLIRFPRWLLAWDFIHSSCKLVILPSVQASFYTVDSNNVFYLSLSLLLIFLVI